MASSTKATRFRYSNGEIATAEAAAVFSWEAPVPVNPFWDDIDYCPARNFLGSFSEHELEELPIDPSSTDTPDAKLQLLLRLLQEKLAYEEAAASPPQSLHDTNYTRWYDLWQAIYALQSASGLLEEPGTTARMLVARQPEHSADVRPRHILAEHLVKVGKYAEAEDTARPVCAWMDAQPRLGKGSPQAINSRRMIAKALWGQGPPRRAEAEALLAEIDEIVDGMGVGGGRFAVYQEEEKRLNVQMRAELKE
ncbi:hypothetical protein B0I37DRAFT_191181 [Chaetomium sp. MPI-CAGE-AT-0009]|nr:hypothetical protein B0I37DRAFT_191181 [Chaetomium sp. MPI-CAGE-AT-0009]